MTPEAVRSTLAEAGADPTSPTLTPVDSAAGPGSLVVDGVSRSYRGHQVLKDVDLAVQPGEWVSITGANGAGKTTLLRIVAGVITADSGRVTLGGIEHASDRRAYQSQIGFLSAGDRGLYARLTVRQNLDFWARISLLDGRKAAAAIDVAIGRFGLEELARRRVDRLSMGQRQRARLAMTFLHDPRLLLLDEPRTSLDTDGVNLIKAALDDSLARGASVLWVAPAGDPELDGRFRRLAVEGGALREL